MTSETGFLDGLLEDGRPLLRLTAVALLLSGAFALFLSARHEFLPHDIDFLGMSAAQLCRMADCRVVRFMFHDRVAFGGTLLAIGTLYLWLITFPLGRGEAWAWWALLLSGGLGFASFLAYLGYGYLDTWHGAATLALIPIFGLGVWRTRPLAHTAAVGWLRTGAGRAAPPLARLGRIGMLLTGLGMLAAGAVILILGSTRVFVPQDLAFMGLTRDALEHINARLIPLIAHDRAGFGGGLASTGLLVCFCAWFAAPTRSFWQAILSAALFGFGCAIGIHYVEGYTNPTHLVPAWAGAFLFFGSAACEWLGYHGVRPRPADQRPGEA
jgi:hypothetical protein